MQPCNNNNHELFKRSERTIIEYNRINRPLPSSLYAGRLIRLFYDRKQKDLNYGHANKPNTQFLFFIFGVSVAT